MSFEVKSLSVLSTDNIHTLQGKIYIPSGKVKGLFHIIHGMTEHIGRYDKFMSFLAENGYIAFAFDNLGHGKTVNDASELGFISHKNGWNFLVDDVNAFETVVVKMFPSLPLYLFGHSMGSFIARIAAEKFKQNYEKIIFCGTGGKNILTPLGLLITKIIGFFKGEKYISKLVIAMAFGSYNKHFEGNSSRDWLTKDQDVIEAYKNDKLCNYYFTVSAMHDLIKLNSICNRNAWFKNLNQSTPKLLISGKSDPVGDYGKGVNWVYNKLVKNRQSAKIKLYDDCRHEIFNDSCKEEVMSDILNFISN